MTTKHTPGPWKNGLDTKGKPVIFQRTDDPCLTFEDINVEWQANLMLASAAPDLLEALQLAHATLCGANMNKKIVEQKVMAAIAKAKGE